MINVNFFELEKIFLALSSVSLKGEGQLKMAQNLINLKRILFNFAKERDGIVLSYYPEGKVDENAACFPNFNKEMEALFSKQMEVDFSLLEKINASDLDLSKDNNQNYLAVLLELGLIVRNA